MDSPRYATGYTTLFNSLGSVPETHMLKPYKDRVGVTYEYMISTINYVDKNSQKIKKLKAENLKNYTVGKKYPLQWEIDSSKVSKMEFKGYKGDYKTSEVTGKKRLYYDQKQPFTKKINFYSDYKAIKEITIPSHYVIPKSQWPILDLLKLNAIEMKSMENDTVIEVESYKIEHYETAKRLYEGHYGHYNTIVSSSTEKIAFKKGDFLVKTQQEGVKYLLETLEPEAVDSYFNWNFFDAILQQKEYFSSYVFEDLAKEFLDKNPKIKAELEQKKQEDKKFAEKNEQFDIFFEIQYFFQG